MIVPGGAPVKPPNNQYAIQVYHICSCRLRGLCAGCSRRFSGRARWKSMCKVRLNAANSELRNPLTQP